MIYFLGVIAAVAVISIVLLLRSRPKPVVRPTWDVDPIYPSDWQTVTSAAVPVFVAPHSTSVFTRSVEDDRRKTYSSDSGDLGLAAFAAVVLSDSSSSDPSPSCDSSYDSGSSCSDSGSSYDSGSSSFDGGSSGGGGADGSWS